MTVEQDVRRWAVMRASSATVLAARAMALVDRVALTAVRISLAVVFVWFGALKLTGHSPVAALIRETLPWFDSALVVPALGVVELTLGLALLVDRLRRLAALALVAHLTGTFLTFVVAPNLMVEHHDPLMLTADGEFVLKNIVLISAALLLFTATNWRSRRGSSDTHAVT